MQRVVQMRHQLIGAINGQRVLNQVVGTDRQKIEMLQKHGHNQGCSGYLDHGANPNVAIRHAARIQLRSRAINQFQGLANLAQMRQHGHHHMDAPMRSRPQNSAQLRQEHCGVSQAPANGAQTQSRVEMAGVTDAVIQRFVCPHVHGANGQRQTIHALHRTEVGLVLLFFIGQACAPHEQKFAAKQPHAHRARSHGSLCIFWQFDIGQQLDRLAVARNGGRVSQAFQLATLARILLLAQAIAGNHIRRRIDQHFARITINDDPVIIPHQLAGIARTHHGRYAHATRHNGRMAVFATHIGHEALKHPLAKVHHVGRRQVMRHQHQRHITGRGLHSRLPIGQGGMLPMQTLDDTLDHLFQVGLAFAQIGVLHLIELARQTLELVRQGPTCVIEALGDPMPHPVENAFVLQQHQMHFEQGRQFAGRIFGQSSQHELHFLNDGIARLQHAVDFGLDRFWLDEVMLHSRPAGGQHLGAANGHAAPHANALYHQGRTGNSHRLVRLCCGGACSTVCALHYSPSPNLSLNSATMASMASCSCSPDVSKTTSAPSPAASIITPMMLLALMRRAPRANQTSHGNVAASLLSLAEARACRPSLLLMMMVC